LNAIAITGDEAGAMIKTSGDIVPPSPPAPARPEADQIRAEQSTALATVKGNPAL